MSEGGEDQEQKTEDASQHRLDEAAKKGQIPVSRELPHFFAMLTLTIIISMLFPGIMTRAMSELAPFVTRPHDYLISDSIVSDMLEQAARIIAVALIGPLGLVILLVAGTSMLQGRFIVAMDRISPKWEKISPVKGLKRLFSMRTVMEFLKGLVKIGVIGAVAYTAIAKEMHVLETLPAYEIMDMMLLLSHMAVKIMVGICCVLFVISGVDFAYQHFDFMKSMRMSKQEHRDEYKQQEGDPHIKSKLRAIRMERAKKRMMANVPKADVVITNPTHYAIALQYDSDSMKAPVLLAKGVDEVAFRIRDVAKDHNIPIVENPPLARTLHASVEVDQEIPYEHYKAVAEVIGYVYRLHGKKKKEKKEK